MIVNCFDMLSFLCVSILLLYLFLRLSRGITKSATCLVGKTAIVTGANSGIGYQVTLNLASRGCRVIMADVADLEESKTNAIKYTNNTNIITKNLDLSSLKSVRDFASDVLKTEDRLDILVNNAGIFPSSEKNTDDNLNLAMQVNYFGHFLLTHLLIELLKKSTPSRIVFTSSIAAFFHRLTLDKLSGDFRKSNYAKVEWYSNSKFAVLVASDLFAEKLKNSGVTCNSVHPGIVKSALKNKVSSALGMSIYGMITMFCYLIGSRDPWEGSQTSVHVAVSKKLEKTTGKFFLDCRPFLKPRKAYDRQFCKELWEASEVLVGLKAEEKM